MGGVWPIRPCTDDEGSHDTEDDDEGSHDEDDTDGTDDTKDDDDAEDADGGGSLDPRIGSEEPT